MFILGTTDLAGITTVGSTSGVADLTTNMFINRQ